MSEYKPLTCLPVLPLRGIVVFPGCVTHFDVGRSKSARAVEEAMRGDQMIFLVAQRDVQCDEPKEADLYADRHRRLCPPDPAAAGRQYAHPGRGQIRAPS